MENILEVKGLETSFFTSGGEVKAVRGVSFDVVRGEVLGIVGESGSGKSVTNMSILHLLSGSGKIKEGLIKFEGENLIDLNKKEIRKIRGAKISMIFQDPMSSLNPLIPVGNQVYEMIKEHNPKMNKKDIKAEVIRLFELVRIPQASKSYKSYPHEFSGGMRQRVMISIALACKPDILIADEPTTALDVTIQDQILKLLRSLQDEFGMSIIFITHDLGVVAEICDRVVVMYGGLVMEEALVDDLFENPLHPYTMGLLESIPNINQDKSKKLLSIPGSPPDMTKPSVGCPFSPRCIYARNICADKMPPMVNIDATHRSMCWLLTEDAPLEDNPFKGEKEVKYE